MRKSIFYKNTKSFLGLTGGIESTATLKYLLDETDNIVYTHFVKLNDGSGKCLREEQAVNKVVEYFHNQGYKFEHSTTEVNMEHIVYSDATFWAFFITQKMIQQLVSDAKPEEYSYEVVWGLNDECYTKGMYDFQDRFNQIDRMITACCENENVSWMANRNVSWYLDDKSKKECYDYLPNELKNIVWSCRNPIFIGEDRKNSNSWKVCGECLGCIDRKNGEIK
jgi:hypothetical protein